MNNTEFIKYMNTHSYVKKNSPILEKFYELSENARKITTKIKIIVIIVKIIFTFFIVK